MLEKTEGIVLKTIKYGESSLIVKLFTEKFGLIPVIFKGIRNSKKKEFTILQPGFIIDIFIYYKENKNILLSKEKNIHYLFQTITQDIAKLSVVYFIVEIAIRCIKEHQVSTKEYLFIKNFLIQLDNETGSIENYPMLFMSQLSYLLGFKPMYEKTEEQAFFNLEKGVFENIPQPQIHQDSESSTLLHKMLTLLDKNKTIAFNPTERKKILDTWIVYYQHQIPDFKQLQTPHILHQLFHNK